MARPTNLEIIQSIRERDRELGQRLIDNYFLSNDPSDQKEVKWFCDRFVAS